MPPAAKPVEPIYTAHLYPDLHGHLLDLLSSLSDQDWFRPTVCKGWTVHDIASHILDTQIRLLSAGRDQHAPFSPDEPLVDFLNRLNAEWIKAGKRISPRLLIAFLSITGDELGEYVTSLDPHANALFPVAWAGEQQSANWFDIGRNYTEYWHHQQQIRDAVGAPPLASHEWLHPVIALFLRALPHTYRNCRREPGTALQIDIEGSAGGQWFLLSTGGGWSLHVGSTANPAAQITLSDDDVWRLFTRGLTPEKTQSKVRRLGDPELGDIFLTALAIMA